MSWDSYTHKDLSNDYEGTHVKCVCSKCGDTWDKGQQGDNETLCVFCEYDQTYSRDED